MKKLLAQVAKITLIVKGGGKLLKGLLRLMLFVGVGVLCYKFFDTYRYRLLGGGDNGIINE